MQAYHSNAYLVNHVGGSEDNRDTQLFNELAKDTDYFRHFPRSAKISQMGIYDCFFLKNGILFSGTTRNKPLPRVDVDVMALQYYGHAEPVRMFIPSQSDNVIWNVRPGR